MHHLWPNYPPLTLGRLAVVQQLVSKTKQEIIAMVVAKTLLDKRLHSVPVTRNLVKHTDKLVRR